MPQAATQSNNAPPSLPPGYTLDSDSGLPPGYTLDESTKAEAPKKQGAASRFNESLSTGLGARPGFTDTLKDMGGGLKHMVTHPIDSAKLLAQGANDSQQQVIDQAYQEQQSPLPWTKAKGYVRGVESAVPFLGPILSKAGDEFSGGNVAGGMGSTAAATLPFLTGSPGAASATEKAGSGIARGMEQASDATGAALRTPKGALKPGVKAVSRLAGAGLGHFAGLPGAGELGGMIVGPSLADMLIPNHPNPPGLFSKIPMRVPKQIPAETSPFEGMTASASPGGSNLQLPKGELPAGESTPFPMVKSRAQMTGSAAEPFEPLVFESPEEAAAHDFRMRNLKRQASSAGTYHAAQGAAGKRTNLQQRIGKKLLPWESQ